MAPQGAEITEESSALPDDAAMTETALDRLAASYPEMAEWVRKAYPDAVWWTAEGYAAKMRGEQMSLRESEGQVIGWNSDGVVTVTSEYIDSARSADEEILSLLNDAG